MVGAVRYGAIASQDRKIACLTNCYAKLVTVQGSVNVNRVGKHEQLTKKPINIVISIC